MDGPNSTPSILIVEEDSDVRSALREVLEFAGYAVAVAADVQAATWWVPRLEGLRLILLRWARWSDRQTAEFIQSVRREPAHGHVPILLLPGENRPPLPGAQGVLIKPFSLDQLLTVVAGFHG